MIFRVTDPTLLQTEPSLTFHLLKGNATNSSSTRVMISAVFVYTARCRLLKTTLSTVVICSEGRAEREGVSGSNVFSDFCL